MSSKIDCSKVDQNASAQFAMIKEVDELEKQKIQYITKQSSAYLGDTSVQVVGGSVFLAKTAVSKSLTFGLPNMGICDSIKTEIKQDKSVLKMEWDF